MANEATILSSLQIVKNNLNYRSSPTAFRATVTGEKGPVPGAISVSPYGTNIDLSQLDNPSLCRVYNLSTTTIVTYGINDPELGIFFPFGEILPGESYVLRLSRFLQEETGTGSATGTTTAETNRLRFRAEGVSDVNVVIEAFER